MQGQRHRSRFILLYVEIQFSQHDLLKRLSFLQYMFFTQLSSISKLSLCGFITCSIFYCTGLHVWFCAYIVLVLFLRLCNIIWDQVLGLLFLLKIAVEILVFCASKAGKKVKGSLGEIRRDRERSPLPVNLFKAFVISTPRIPSPLTTAWGLSLFLAMSLKFSRNLINPFTGKGRGLNPLYLMAPGFNL